MNINVTGINKTTGIDNGAVQGQTTAGNSAAGRLQAPVTPQAAREAGLRLLMNLDSGDVFTGEITNITNNEITIALSDSANVTALLSDALSYNVGDVLVEPLECLDTENIILCERTENIIEKMEGEFKYKLRGELKNMEKGIVEVKGFALHIDEDKIPKDVSNGMCIQFEVSRIDIW